MHKIKVSLIMYSKFPINGGYENLVYDLSEQLSLTEDIQVICTETTSEKSILNQVGVFPILKTSSIRYIGFFFVMIFNITNFFIYLRKERPDIINAHPSFPAGFIALIPAKLLKIPVICTSHGVDIQINHEIGYGIRLNKIAAFLLKFTLKHCDIHTVVSNSMIKSAIDSGSKISKIHIIENGIKLPLLKTKQNNILNKLKIKKNDFVILYLGRLHPIKRAEDLIIAFSSIYTKIPEAKLIITGAGVEESKLKNLATTLNIQNRVIFTGFISAENGKWELLNRCDIFVLPSILEGLPIGVIEAMGCGKPVIATNIEPFQGVITNNKNGILVNPKSPEDISKAILDLANNKEKRFKMGKLAKIEFDQRFNIEKVSNNYLKLYQKLALNEKDHE